MSTADAARGIKALFTAGPHEPVGVVYAHLLAVVDLVAITIIPGSILIVDLDITWTCQLPWPGQAGKADIGWEEARNSPS
jgi:hypothetical protein